MISKTDIKKYSVKIAGKLLAEGLIPSSYTKAKAKKLTTNVALPKFVHNMIDNFSKEIKSEMAKMYKKKK